MPVVYMRLNGTSPFERHYLPYLSMPNEHSSSEADAVALAWLLDWVGIYDSTEPCRRNDFSSVTFCGAGAETRACTLSSSGCNLCGTRDS